MNLTLAQIAKKTGMSKRAVQMRCRRQQWQPSGTIIVNFNEAKTYDIRTLPDDINALIKRGGKPKTCSRHCCFRKR